MNCKLQKLGSFRYRHDLANFIDTCTSLNGKTNEGGEIRHRFDLNSTITKVSFNSLVTIGARETSNEQVQTCIGFCMCRGTIVQPKITQTVIYMLLILLLFHFCNYTHNEL